MNLTGMVESPSLPGYPYLVDADGRPYLPVGDAGVVLGVRLGDGVFAHDADHAAPGVTLAHPDQAARHALTGYACFGNRAEVRTGDAAGAAGVVLGKRGEEGRVIVVFPDDVLARLVPGDGIAVRVHGQGATLPDTPGVRMLNTDPEALAALRMTASGDALRIGVRGRVPSEVVGNGIGRPAELWDLDLQLSAPDAGRYGLAGLRLGDLVAVDDLDVRHNAGFRHGWRTVGLIVHGGSPLPGHGPGLMPILCGPVESLTVVAEGDDHLGVRHDDLGLRS